MKQPRKCRTAVVTEREYLSKVCSQGTSMDDDFLPLPAYQKNQNTKTNKTRTSTEKNKSATAMPSRRGLQMLLQVCILYILSVELGSLPGIRPEKRFL